MATIETDRLMLRVPVEADRERFVELFTDEAGTKHRIQMVRIIDGSHHRCFCVAP